MPGLPWWGLILSSKDKRLLTALLDSGERLTQLLAHPGWSDVEAVFRDWYSRYTEQAGRLGQQMEERHGQWVLRESDTPEDDRRRLIACAQAAALRGVLDELRQRAKIRDHFFKRQEQERKVRGTTEVESLV